MIECSEMILRSTLLRVLFGLLLLGSSTCLFTEAKCPESAAGASHGPRQIADFQGGCTSVRTYAEFKAAIKQASTSGSVNLVFCPFSIVKEEEESPVMLYGDVTLSCRYNNFCYISGGGSHLIIYGAKTSATIQGFVFRGASSSALRIWSNTPLEQNICSCHFTDNNAEDGGAIRAEKGTNLNTEESKFRRNKARIMGGGIYSKGELRLIENIFQENEARNGGAVASIEYTKVVGGQYNGNIALSSGPALYFDGDASKDLNFEGDIRAWSNELRMTAIPLLGMSMDQSVRGECNGAMIRKTSSCKDFVTKVAIKSQVEVSAMTESFLPTNTPTKLTEMSIINPTVSPTSSPITDIPTQRPTSLPVSAEPTDKPSKAPVTASPTDTPSTKPTRKPTLPIFSQTLVPDQILIPDSVEPKQPPDDYFSYNPSSRYGPNNWGKIKASKTSEYQYWSEFKDLINPPLEINYCRWNSGNHANKQSPLNIVDTGAKCEEYHEIRHKPGDWLLTDKEVSLEFHPNKLRVVWPRRIDNRPEPDTPSSDIPKGWGNFIDAIHTDLVIPAEHTINGKRYDGEWRVYHMHPGGKGTAVVTVLIESGHEKNPTFQQFLKPFEDLFEYHRFQCLFNRRRLQSTTKQGFDFAGLEQEMEDKYSHMLGNITSFESFCDQKRRLQNAVDDFIVPLYDHGDVTDPLTSKGRFNPFHKNLVTSVWFYGYFGSITEPPCYPIATWRIIDKPMKISDKQLAQMKKLLFEHLDPDCEYTSNHYRESVARPIQKNIKRDIHKCTCKNFLSDAERRTTGQYICDSSISEHGV